MEPVGELRVERISVGNYSLTTTSSAFDYAPLQEPIFIYFSVPVDTAGASIFFRLDTEGVQVPTVLKYEDNNKTAILRPNEALQSNSSYTIYIDPQLQGARGEAWEGGTFSFQTQRGTLKIQSVKIDGKPSEANALKEVTLTPVIAIEFDHPVQASSLTTDNVRVTDGDGAVAITLSLDASGKVLTITSQEKLINLQRHRLSLSNIQGSNQEIFDPFVTTFCTTPEDAPDFPMISDNELLTKVQLHTFRYFYDFAHPASSGMARERNTSGDLVTTGGSGFGIMALLVGVERGFITRNDAVARLDRILTFLEKADRFHGAWPLPADSSGLRTLEYFP